VSREAWGGTPRRTPRGWLRRSGGRGDHMGWAGKGWLWVMFLRRTLFWGACSVYLMSSRVGLGDRHSPFWGFHFWETVVSRWCCPPWPLGLLRDSWRGAGRTGRSSPLGTHGNGTVWRGEITGGLTRGFAIAPSRVLNNKVELGGWRVPCAPPPCCKSWGWRCL